jgi:hypothetical protein
MAELTFVPVVTVATGFNKNAEHLKKLQSDQYEASMLSATRCGGKWQNRDKQIVFLARKMKTSTQL